MSGPRPVVKPLFLSDLADPEPITDKRPWDKKEACNEAITKARDTGRPIVVDGTFKIDEYPTALRPDPTAPGGGGLHLIGQPGPDGSTARFEGYGGWGFHVYGKFVDVSGELIFNGFRQDGRDGQPNRVGPGTDWQGDGGGGVRGARGACIGIEASDIGPAQLRYVYIGPGVQFLNSKAGITCSGSGLNSYSENFSNRIDRVTIDGLFANHVANPIIFTGASAREGIVENCRIYNVISGARSNGAIIIGPDDIPSNDELDLLWEHQKYGPFHVTNCVIKNVIQKVTTGTSDTAGGVNRQYSATGIICNGVGAIIADNTLINITGVNRDCEAIYSKSWGGSITGNTMINAGTNEAAIAIKGYDPKFLRAGLSSREAIKGKGLGADMLCANNNIRFDEYVYSHDGVGAIIDPDLGGPQPSTVELERIGITINSGDNAIVVNNSIKGCNGPAIRIDTDDSAYDIKANTTVRGNRILEHRGYVGIEFTDGEFDNTKILDNEMQFAADENAQRFSREAGVAKDRGEWQPIRTIIGIGSRRTVNRITNAAINRNGLELLGTEQQKEASTVSIQIADKNNIEGLQINDNEITGKGLYDARTVVLNVDELSTATSTVHVEAYNTRNTYQSPYGKAQLLAATRGGIPRDFAFTGTQILPKVTAGDFYKSRIFELPLFEQTIKVEVKWSATRLDVDAKTPYVAEGVYEAVLTQPTPDDPMAPDVIARPGFVGWEPEPTKSITDPNDATATIDVKIEPSDPTHPYAVASPNYKATGDDLRFLQGVRDADIGERQEINRVIAAIAAEAGLVTIPSLAVPPSVLTATDLWRTPRAGELVQATERLAAQPSNGISAETYPRLSSPRFEERVGYPKIYTRAEPRVNDKGKLTWVSVCRAWVKDGEWQFFLDVRI